MTLFDWFGTRDRDHDYFKFIQILPKYISFVLIEFIYDNLIFHMFHLSSTHLIPVSLSVDGLYGHHLPPTFPHFQNNSKLKLKTWFSRLKVFETENSMFSKPKAWSTGFLTALAACEAISCKTVKRPTQAQL